MAAHPRPQETLLLDGDADVHPGHWCVGSGHIETQTHTVSDPGRNHEVELVRQESGATPGARAARFEPHLTATTADGAGMQKRYVDRYSEACVGLPWGQTDFG